MARARSTQDLQLVGGMVKNICFANARNYFGLELAPDSAVAGSPFPKTFSALQPRPSVGGCPPTARRAIELLRHESLRPELSPPHPLPLDDLARCCSSRRRSINGPQHLGVSGRRCNQVFNWTDQDWANINVAFKAPTRSGCSAMGRSSIGSARESLLGFHRHLESLGHAHAWCARRSA